MTLQQFLIEVLKESCETLTRFGHCEASWGVAFNGVGPHAFGHHWNERRQFAGINLDAASAIEVAGRYERGERP